MVDQFWLGKRIRPMKARNIIDSSEVIIGEHKNIILYFFPSIFTQYALDTLLELEEYVDQLIKQGIQLIAISPDEELETYEYISDELYEKIHNTVYYIRYPILFDERVAISRSFRTLMGNSEIINNCFISIKNNILHSALYLDYLNKPNVESAMKLLGVKNV